jgi:hypothetical protein
LRMVDEGRHIVIGNEAGADDRNLHGAFLSWPRQKLAA